MMGRLVDRILCLGVLVAAIVLGPALSLAEGIRYTCNDTDRLTQARYPDGKTIYDSCDNNGNRLMRTGITRSSSIDLDVNGKTDGGIFRPSTGDWHIRESSNPTMTSISWGGASDIPMRGGTKK